jgi:hypothetical protein
MHAFAGARHDAVDIYNSATGVWATAQLSVARDRLAATSVGNMALFVGGSYYGTIWRMDKEWLFSMISFVFLLFDMCDAIAQ